MSRTVSILFLFVGLALSGVPGSAVAQETRSLVICDNTVFINGRVVSENALPATLNLEGVDARFSFSGEVEPIIEINDRIYRLEDDQLHDLGPASNRSGRISVFFRDGAQPAESSQHREVRFFVGDDYSSSGRVSPNYAVVAQHAQAIHEQVAELHSRGFGSEQQALQQMMEELLVQARQTAAIAEELPRLETQNYLLDLQQQNQELYSLLTREYTLERETRELAEEIRALEEGAQRERLVEELRERLEEIFEIKQQNRQHEIDRLESELEELRHRLEKRERFRDRIIERRLRDLTGERRERRRGRRR